MRRRVDSGQAPRNTWRRRLCPSRLQVLGVLASLGLGLASPTSAQFGQNKVQYRSFDWKILETEHFLLHFYSAERGTAEEAARMAERGYEYLSDFFDYQFEDKIPVILYSTHQDFEQSNVIGGFIGEGTGGVTEGSRGRVILPLTGSYAELDHVLVHELVHAFQFDMLKSNFLGQGLGNVPLWMMEGMAEWVSNGMDPITAMWILDAKRSDKVPTVQQMATVQDIRVYRMGQALFEVISANYGPERIQRILKRPSGRRNVRADSTFTPLPPPTTTINTVPGEESPQFFGSGTSDRQSLEQLWRVYTDSIGTVLSERLVEPDSIAETIVRGDKYGRSYHLAPVASRDGRRVLYYSSRGLSNELFLAEQTETGWKKRLLVEGETTPELEALPLLSASADWSPDENQVVFISTKQGRDVLQILDVAKRRIRRTIETELSSIQNPSYSPDGHWIVFSALVGGEEDLFVVGIESGQLVRLTEDGYAERTPRFSPDGNSIVFATDRGPETQLGDLLFGTWNVARLDLRRDGDRIVGGDVNLVVDSPANEFSPVWSPDGKSLAFVSDRSGTYQVYTYAFETGTVIQRTRFASGVVGIIPTGPALSWAANGDVVYSVFQRGGWHLYKTRGFPLQEDATPDSTRMALTRSRPEELDSRADDRLSTTEKNYRARLSPEYGVIGALYIGNAGAAGSGALLLSDMLRNHYLYLAGNLRSEFNDSEILVQYANLGRRWQWGVAAYQFREDYLVFSASDRADLESTVRRGLGGTVHYPFNRFRRIEFSLDMQVLSQETARFLFANDQFLQTSSLSSGNVYLAIPGVALVHDNSAYSGFTPIAGRRWRLEYNRAVGDISYNFQLLDYRRYFNIQRRGAVATRFLTATSWGDDDELLRVGGPYSFRGADFGALEGTSVAVANVELRFPIIPTTELLRGVIFYDAATSWGHGTSLDGAPLGSVALGDLEGRDIQSAVGVGVRGYIGLPLKFDAAFPLGSERDTQTFFSIGFDF